MYVFCIVSKGGREEGKRTFRRIAKQVYPLLKRRMAT